MTRIRVPRRAIVAVDVESIGRGSWTTSDRISPVRRVVHGLSSPWLESRLTATSVVHPAATHPNVDCRAKHAVRTQPADRRSRTRRRSPPAAPVGCHHRRPTRQPPAGRAPPRHRRPGAIPPTALAAYRKAAATLAVEDASCHLTWPLLAGIGKVETDHGRSWGAAARITATGEVVPTILGPVLNGHNGTALVLDTDGGAYDHDRQYDRAVGPMQFVPATWAELGRDGNGDGIEGPQQHLGRHPRGRRLPVRRRP